ncbi:hypothetical protein PBI_WINKY_29 [Mycobacterium phage Winky]|uniref:Uncharacterized protein n=1 Tax=Mycobacterium phage Faith1 TaxID=2920893 RepID=F6M824_9CAUD|nr:holin [Mycobacterium phage Faith1]AGK87592.1 hypothetical protein PBI_WINKY_29 [Mycobacterium phage Winky]AGM12638.1 hypothetical protein PBI_BREEZONA_29 [Mycobacterium phage Breezona]ASM62635.1 hypothetical protein SEA_MILEY16_29 [Mycobacterium phage Miley16]AYN57076.1 hypothetical protein PBI_BIGCHEESE_29 [Mycobacterium phage BigCheese]QGZ16994.1 hypothetical protein PBI_ITOS_29 [Mycobacterium phage Itos]QSM00943.1 hypothetical protein SEA_NETYAP_29 [Mycobacterium phage Netyap]QYW00927.
MLIYDEQVPVLDDTFEGDEVSLLAVRGGRVDRNFRRNYAWAKHAADRGKLKKIVVKVAVNKDSWVHTVGAVTSALSGQRLHPLAAFNVDSDVRDIGGDKLTQVLEALKELSPKPAAFMASNADVKALVRAQNAQAKNAPKPGPKSETKNVEDVKDGE